jgi:hypothetical protein
MFMKLGMRALVLATSLTPVICIQANNADTANKSINPLNLAPGLNLRDYYSPKLYDTNAHSNDALLRGALPRPAQAVCNVLQGLRLYPAKPEVASGHWKMPRLTPVPSKQ